MKYFSKILRSRLLPGSWIGLTLVILGFGSLNAEEAELLPVPSDAVAEAPVKEEMPMPPLEVAPSSPSAATSLPDFKPERDRLLLTLSKDIEPNLPRGDVEKLTRSVMRLGSYRKDWVDKGQEFLIANAPLAELYLYRFSQARNRRLNEMILDTLVRFQSYRFPRAPLAFLESLSLDQNQKIKVLKVLERIAANNPQIIPEVMQILETGFASDISLDYRLQFGVQLCSQVTRGTPEVRATLNNWLRSASQFWEQMVAAELNACLRGV